MINFSTVGRDCTLDERQQYFEWDNQNGERERIAKEIRDLEESGAPTESILTFLTAHRATYLSTDTLVPLARGFLFEMYRRFTNAENAEEEFNSDNIVENLRKIADAIESGGELSLL